MGLYIGAEQEVVWAAEGAKQRTRTIGRKSGQTRTTSWHCSQVRKGGAQVREGGAQVSKGMAPVREGGAQVSKGMTQVRKGGAQELLTN